MVCCERSPIFLRRRFEPFSRGNAKRCTSRSYTSSALYVLASPYSSILSRAASAVLAPRPGGACCFRFIKAFHGVEPHHGAVYLFSKYHVRFGAAFNFWESYGAVRCGAVRFSHFFQNHTVRCSAFFLVNGVMRFGL